MTRGFGTMELLASLLVLGALVVVVFPLIPQRGCGSMSRRLAMSKQVARGMLLYEGEHGALPPRDWRRAVQSDGYLKSGDILVSKAPSCPYDFAFRPSLIGKRLTAVEDPTNMGMIFDTLSSPSPHLAEPKDLAFRKETRGSGVKGTLAYADGHVKNISVDRLKDVK